MRQNAYRIGVHLALPVALATAAAPLIYPAHHAVVGDTLGQHVAQVQPVDEPPGCHQVGTRGARRRRRHIALPGLARVGIGFTKPAVERGEGLLIDAGDRVGGQGLGGLIALVGDVQVAYQRIQPVAVGAPGQRTQLQVGQHLIGGPVDGGDGSGLLY